MFYKYERCALNSALTQQTHETEDKQGILMQQSALKELHPFKSYEL
uniref:Uncharacterized protein n=1 Tax=Romanomermis culicivorax TaxID=13658 RepID=A0A915KE81_ROMCU